MSETAHSTQTKAPPGGGASWVFHACSIGLAVSPGGRNIGKPTTPTPSRAVGCALRGGPQKKPRHGSGAKLVLPRPWAGQGGKRPMQECPDGFIKFHNGRLSIKNSIKLKKACVYSRALCLSPDRQQNKDIEAVAVGFLPPRQHVYPAQRHLLLGGVERRENAPLRRG